MSQTDELLRRIERRALVLSAVAVVAAWVVPGGGASMAAAVAGGAFISGLSYWAIKRGVDGIANAVLTPGARPGARFSGRSFLAFVARYALLAGIAYVMIVRLRLPPLGLLGGASVIPVATAAELVRRRS
jgi:hypothetical protein